LFRAESGYPVRATLLPYAAILVSATIEQMEMLITIAIRLLEAMFVVGGIGSLLVIILSGIEDIGTLLGSDEGEQH